MFVVPWLVALAIVQGAFFAARGVIDRPSVVGLALAVVLCVEAWSPWLTGKNRANSVLVLSMLVVLNYAEYLYRTLPPYPMRLLQVGLIVGYAAAALAALIPWLSLPRKKAVIAIAFAASTVLIAEAELGVPSPMEGRVGWEGGGQTDRSTGGYVPGSLLRTTYPDDPRNYFEDREALRASWRLDVHDTASAAKLEFPLGVSRAVRVNIEKTSAKDWWGIQLNLTPLRVTNERYRLTLRLRSDTPRKVSIALSMAHWPWAGLGFAVEEQATASWRVVEHEFTPHASDDVARLHLDLGRESPSVEIRDVQLQRVSDQQPLYATVPTVHTVSYRINSEGCRGPELAAAHPDSRRILSLGDSYAMGIGVHEGDVFATRAAVELTDSGSTAFSGKVETVNCGMTGMDAVIARQRFGLLQSKYQPDLVVLTLGAMDERTWEEEAARQTVAHAGRWRYLFGLLQRLPRRSESLDPLATPQQIVQDVIELKRSCDAARTRLVVVVSPVEALGGTSSRMRDIVRAFAEHQIDLLDLSQDPVLVPRPDSLFVHPLYDHHPNERLHQRAAQQLAAFIRRHELLRPFPSS